MTKEEKVRAYDEALERAQKAMRAGSDVAMDIIQYIFPELKESDDERIRKEIISALKFANDDGVYDKHIAWLEKQKETLKSANSISSDCWHKVADSFPDSTREVICKDAIGNFFIGRYHKGSDSWEVSMYDDADKSNEDNPPVVMWCDIPIVLKI